MKQKMINFGVMNLHTAHRTHWLGNGLKLFLFFWMLMKTDVGWGQNESCEPIYCSEIALENKNLSFTGTRPNIAIESFFDGNVSPWQSGSFTAHTIDYDVNHSYACKFELDNPISSNRVERNCISSSSNFNESVFQILPNNHRFDPSVDYCIEVDMQLLRCGPWSSFELELELRSAMGLTNTKGAFPTNAINEMIGIRSVNSLIAGKYVFSFTPHVESDPNLWKNQLWVIASANSSNTATISINDITIKCRTNALTSVGSTNLGSNIFRFNANETKSFSTYDWTINNNTVFGNTNVLIHEFEDPGTYTICLSVTDEYGCCGVECTEVLICGEIDEPEIHRRTNYCSSYTFSIENPDPTMTYTWNISGGIPSTGTGTMFSTMIADNGLYTISVTGQNACGTVSSSETFPVLCSTDPPTCTNQTNCIQIGEDANSVTRLSDLMDEDHPIIPATFWFGQPQVSNLCFSVEGRLIIDIWNIAFLNTRWFMGPGAEIEITPAGIWGARWLIDSNFEGCDYMWRGIIVREETPGFFGGGGVALVGTTIEDAWRGVELENNVTFNAEECMFYDNYTAVHMGNNNINSNIFTAFNGCTFENTGNMLQLYNTQLNWALRAQYGIFASRINFLDLQATDRINTFKNLSVGIEATLSNANISNARFIDTDKFFSRGIKIGKNNNVIQIFDNSFTNLAEAIFCEEGTRGAINITNNDFIDNTEHEKNRPVTGVNIYNMTSSVSNINNNNFQFNSGLCLNITNSSKFDFMDNEITLTNSYGALPAICNISNVHEKSIIDNPDINIWHFNLNSPFSGPFIDLLNCSKIEILNNNFSLDSEGGFNGKGISLLGANKCLIKNNYLNFPMEYGILSYGTDQVEGNGYCCNSAVVSSDPLTSNSFLFQHNNGTSFLRQNELFSLELAGKFGPQENAGNIWVGLNSRAKLSMGTVEDNLFKIDFTIPGSIPVATIPQNIINDWFVPGGSHPTCETNDDCGIEPFNFQNNDPDLTDISPDPQDTLIIIVDPAKPHCIVVQNLYDRLSKVDSVASPLEYWYIVSTINKWRLWKGEAWIQNCLDSIVSFNPEVIPWYDAEKEKEGVYKVSQSQRQLMAPYMEEILGLIEEISLIELDSTLTLSESEIDLYEDLNMAQINYEYEVNQFKLSMIEKATDLISELELLPIPLPFLVYKKLVWIAEMKIVIGGNNALDSTEWSQVRQIAQKCPAEFGQAVFEAQSLMRRISEEITSDLNCIPSPPRTTKNDELNKRVIVSPNPGNGNFLFEWNEYTNIDKILIFDINGRIIHENKIISDKKQIILDISNESQGIYFWEIIYKDTSISKGKLVKI